MSTAPEALICIDLGTTNTRVWRVSREGRILAKANAQVGVRDTARAGSPAILRLTLHKLLQDVGNDTPIPIIAAGMITSSLGLLEIPHLPAPAGLAELAAATRPHDFPDVSSTPIWLVPGVRCGNSTKNDAVAVAQTDMMRGEETLCIGIVSLGLARGSATVLNLGSHWKAIQLDGAGHITGSVTSLAGEMIHAVQTTTILTSALPDERPDIFDARLLAAGMKQHRASGLARALFGVRLLQVFGDTSAQDRLAYLIGAFVAADLDALLLAKKIGPQWPILLTGNRAVARAWQIALSEVGVTGVALSEEQVEQSMLAGLRSIFTAATIDYPRAKPAIPHLKP
jgi:2-dehydro-3-deoxygalactonokinase